MIDVSKDTLTMDLIENELRSEHIQVEIILNPIPVLPTRGLAALRVNAIFASWFLLVLSCPTREVYEE